MTQMKIREQVIEDLKQYPALKKKIILLRYEQDHPARISDGEVIDSMALSRPVTDGIRSAGFISDKTMRIATQFRDKKERLNQEAVMEIAQEHLSPRTLIKRRDDGLDGLASMYSYLGQVKGGYGNT